MKKTFLFVIALAGIVLSSCLGDNESTYSGSNEFAVVQKTEAGVKYAAVSRMFITWDQIDKYEEGDALFLASFKTSLTGSNISKAEYISIAAEYPNRVQKKADYETADTTANVKAQIGTKAFTRIASNGWDFYKNRSMFDYVVDQKEGDSYDVKFVYDENKQVDKSKAPLPKNTIVLDVIFEKKGEAINNVSESKTKSVVVNLSELKARLKPSSITEPVELIIDLRYSKYNSSKKAFELLYTPKILGFYYSVDK